MKLDFELMAQHILPEVRSIIAKELVFRYRMSQTEAAKLLEISQPAISQYLSNVRGKGKLLQTKAIAEVVQLLAKNIFERRMDEAQFTAELFKIYKMAKENGLVPKSNGSSYILNVAVNEHGVA